MTCMEKKLAFLLATSPHLDTLSGSYDEAARDLVANGVVPVVRCKDCMHRYEMPDGWSLCNRKMAGMIRDSDFCSYGERR